ncbi:hypothetical protein CQW23_27264 [Capsicum baccatum]|uniref:Uncharacterized protein n=1 Tax=Capsicum baccatum TaxID=33114 RepID=A0A2G2VD83_CAPBA|nr:hypothetical protein CQW23_27264 [Capsicum baccatum]
MKWDEKLKSHVQIPRYPVDVDLVEKVEQLLKGKAPARAPLRCSLYNDDYKILKIDVTSVGPEVFNEILALKSGSWKRFRKPSFRVLPVSCGVPSGRDCLAFVHGTFHWVGLSNCGSTIVSFNISNEVYGQIPLLERMRIYRKRYLENEVSVLGGLLCSYSTANYQGEGTFNLWVSSLPRGDTYAHPRGGSQNGFAFMYYGICVCDEHNETHASIPRSERRSALMAGKQIATAKLPNYPKLKVKFPSSGPAGIQLVESQHKLSFEAADNIEVLWNSEKRLKVQYDDILDCDGPEKLEEWIPSYTVANPDNWARDAQDASQFGPNLWRTLPHCILIYEMFYNSYLRGKT